MENDHEHLSYDAMVNYITEKTVPPGLNKHRKSTLRRKSAKFRVKDGLLYYVGKVPGKKGEKTDKLVIKNRDEQLNIVKDSHINENGTHLGRDKTFYRIIQKYYWRGQHEDVTRYVRTCDECQYKSNIKVIKPEERVQPKAESVSLVLGVWQTVEIEILGPLKESVRGRRYIITATDCFSKWPEALPLRDRSITDIVRFLYALFCRYGMCEFHFHDKGKKFVNQIHKELAEKLKIKQSLLPLFQFETSNDATKSNKELKNVLQNLVEKHQEMWDGHVDTCLLSLRATRDPRTNYSPFALMYNREPKLPLVNSHLSKPEEIVASTSLVQLHESQPVLSQTSSATFVLANSNDISMEDETENLNNSASNNTIILSAETNVPLHVASQPTVSQPQRAIVIATTDAAVPLHVNQPIVSQPQGTIVIALENAQALQQIQSSLGSS